MKPCSTMLLVGALAALWMLPLPRAPAQAPTAEELKEFERQAEQLEKKQAAAKAEANRKAEIRDKGGWLGVLIQEVTRELAESFGMDKPHGALVAKVLPDGPAAAAGIKPGDVVVDLEIGELPSEEELKHASPDTTTDNRLKIAVKDLTDYIPHIKQREELELAGHGVVVESVQLGPARLAGIRKGDIVTMIDDERVKDAKHFKELVEALPAGKSVPILVQRADQAAFLAIKVPAE